MALLLTHIHRLYPVATAHERLKRGADMAHAGCLENAWVQTAGAVITGFGSMASCPVPDADTQVMDCTGRLVLPGFVDSHTHLVFPRTREGEFRDRIQGLTYEEIAARGGGILNSARHCETLSEEALLAAALPRAWAALRTGTTTLEIKSGYALTLEGELKLLRVARRIGELTPLRVRTTFLGAHAIPAAYKADRQAYIDLVCDKMLPAVVAEGLADHIDVFCDRGYFTPEETAYIMRRGAEAGLPAKIHANELAISGGVQVGVQQGAWSVDHLEQMDEAAITALQGTDTIPVILPTVAFFLGIPYAPAREMIRADLPVALATDYNPGSSPGSSMPFVMSLACLRQGLSPEEALIAATLNAARALRMSDQIGAISPGRIADILITHPMDDLAGIPYAYAENPVATVIIGGSVIAA
ncbi:MAG: imidazolonepropionase [Bacteroidia bacterium]|nr:imidazolonepropionase [Bacteroidia bacterium]